MRSAAPGVPCFDSVANRRGNTPSFASTRGISACTRIQPFSAPNPLMKANNASVLATWSPQNSRIASANGALDFASSELGISITTTELAKSSAPHRSEEHTSELQSPCNLVSRLLLEKQTDTYRN